MCIIVPNRFIVAIILLPEANAYPWCTLLFTHFTEQDENLSDFYIIQECFFECII